MGNYCKHTSKKPVCTKKSPKGCGMTRAQQRARANVWSKPFRGSGRQRRQTQSEGHPRATRDFFCSRCFFFFSQKPPEEWYGSFSAQTQHNTHKVKRENRGRERACTAIAQFSEKAVKPLRKNAQNTHTWHPSPFVPRLIWLPMCCVCV
jgi:hypothetical protein